MSVGQCWQILLLHLLQHNLLLLHRLRCKLRLRSLFGFDEARSDSGQPLRAALLAVVAEHLLAEEAALAARLAVETARDAVHESNVEHEVLLVAVLLEAEEAGEDLQQTHPAVKVTVSSDSLSSCFALIWA